MRSLHIVGMSIGAATLYGVVHDQITARVCIEYFTVGHPPIFGTDDPTLLGLGWGVLASWWVGLLVGIPLAFAARIGGRPVRNVNSLFGPVLVLFCVTAVCAFAAGIAGWILARNGVVSLVGPVAIELPADRHAPFLADLWAHTASYLVGLVGGIVMVIRVWRSRGSLAPARASTNVAVAI